MYSTVNIYNKKKKKKKPESYDFVISRCLNYFYFVVHPSLFD